MNKQLKQGSSLLIVINIVLVISIATGALSYHATQQMHATRVTREQLKARLIAESGLNKAFHAVKTDFSLVGSYTETANFGDGSYTVSAAPLVAQDGSVSENRAQIVSQGECGIGKAVVTIDIENRPILSSNGGSDDDYFNLVYDILVGGALALGGNFKADVDAVHANGDAAITGSAETDAKVISSAKTATWKKADGSVTLLSNQSPVPVLTEALTAAINALIAYAQANNAEYATGAQIPESPPGGVAYCTGTASGWNAQGNGCFIFAGDATFQGKDFNVQSVNGFPALIVMGTGQVKMNGGEVHGALLIPKGSFWFNGNGEFYGPILVGQGMTGLGTADLYAGDGQGFNLPPTESATDNVVITAWH